MTPSPSSDKVAIKVDGLNYRYPCGVLSLRNLSFEIREGERVGLVGPSGAGKSTLLQHLNGVFPEPAHTDENEACVTILGLPVFQQNLFEVRKAIGLLFQNPDDQLFCSTVAEDVAFGPNQLGLSSQEVQALVSESLTLTALTELAQRSTSQLSYGQKKRACLAGLLACQPQILALDEPFSGLDPQSRQELIQILLEIGGTQLIATHDLEIVLQLCQRVLILNEGTIQADGVPEQILADADLMQKHRLEVPLRLQLQQPTHQGS